MDDDDDRSSTLAASSPAKHPHPDTSPPYSLLTHDFDNDNDEAAPKPPLHLFRPITRLSSPSNTDTSIYLCLPRTLSPPSNFSAKAETERFASRFAKQHSAFQSLPNARMHAQLTLLEHPSVSAGMLFRARYGLSALDSDTIDLLAHCVVVKTSVSPQTLRREADILEHFHLGREYASLHIGSDILRSQFTASPASSWLCLRPVFAPTLQDFGIGYGQRNGGMPSWLIAHICLGLVDAVAFVHEDGYVHGKIEARNIVLNTYPVVFHHRVRGYPDVQLIDFSGAGLVNESSGGVNGDVRALLGVVERVVREWSDVAPFLGVEGEGAGVGKVVETDDPIVLLLRAVRGVLANEKALTLDDVRRGFGSDLEALRHTGPQSVPWPIQKLLHADLATDEEMQDAIREPTVLKLPSMRDQLRRLRDGTRVAMEPDGHARMLTTGTLVVRFEKRRKGWLRIVGEDDVDWEEGMDIEREMVGLDIRDVREDVDMEDV